MWKGTLWWIRKERLHNVTPSNLWWKKTKKKISTSCKRKKKQEKEKLMEITSVAFFTAEIHTSCGILRWRAQHVQKAGRRKNKNQVHSIKWHINSNGREGGRCIKEADENSRSMERVGGWEKKKSTSRLSSPSPQNLRPLLYFFFYPFHIFHISKSLYSMFTSQIFSFSLPPLFHPSLFSVTSLLSFYLTLSPH